VKQNQTIRKGTRRGRVINKRTSKKLRFSARALSRRSGSGVWLKVKKTGITQISAGKDITFHECGTKGHQAGFSLCKLTRQTIQSNFHDSYPKALSHAVFEPFTCDFKPATMEQHLSMARSTMCRKIEQNGLIKSYGNNHITFHS